MTLLTFRTDFQKVMLFLSLPLTDLLLETNSKELEYMYSTFLISLSVTAGWCFEGVDVDWVVLCDWISNDGLALNVGTIFCAKCPGK